MKSCVFLLLSAAALAQSGIQPSDLLQMHSAGNAVFSPDGTRIAYTVSNNDGPRRPYGQLWVMDVRSGATVRFSTGQEGSGNPVWSPDGQWLAFNGTADGKRGLVIAHPDGSARRFLTEVQGTNSPEPYEGATVSWAPDGKQIAFVSSEPGPETANANGDPMVITRYLYRPDAGEGYTHFNDNRRLHIYVVDAASGEVRQLTHGTGYQHSVAWAPKGDEILYAAEHDLDADRFFNNDLFTVNAKTGAIHQLTSTEGVEMDPTWSPDGTKIAYLATKRGLTDRETNMEDTHVWVMNADGSNRTEVGALIDSRQGPPHWSIDGRRLYFTVQDHGSNHLVGMSPPPLESSPPNPSIFKGSTASRMLDFGPVVAEPGFVSSFSIAKDGAVAYTFASPTDTAELFLKLADVVPAAPAGKAAEGRSPARQLTNLNQQLLSQRTIAATESFTFISNDAKFTVEAFLTKPVGFDANKKYPLVLNIHGGPHGQNGPALNLHNQAYAAHGYAVLMVNYRGSTGYGQKFADAVFRDQDGDEAMDVLYAVNAAIRRYPWIDQNRLGCEGVSYGGQLTDWLITQTNMFKAAIPIAGITNFISYNYMTYYNQYEAMEWGAYPHQGNLMDVLWERSPLKHVANVSTPTMFMHGENDPDVPIAEAEQMFVALQDVGVETVMVRYPREGHGLSEPKHQVDSIERAFEWYDRHFAAPQPKPVTSVP
ncbi:MAG: S9 family peptidase [Acidobacteria bacterium]|nr:S9 family peptidase [Acidobacteriota bacterium]